MLAAEEARGTGREQKATGVELHGSYSRAPNGSAGLGDRTDLLPGQPATAVAFR
jgi:hypothetical protein